MTIACSPFRVAANRSNALKSTGPRTAEGKARSRANSHKHGMTGEGIARAEPGASEIEASLAEVTTPMLARRVAVLADRLERLAEHDEVATARRVREARAADDGGEGRHRELDELVASLAEEPAAAVRRLRRSAAGVDRLLGLWDDLARDLAAARPWTDAHRDRAVRLAGRTPGAIGLSRIEALSAVEGPGRAEALGEILALIAAEVAALRAYSLALPAADPARDRAEAASLALFDPSAQAALFRRYELATERNFYKALAEIRKADALGLGLAEPDPTPDPEIPPIPPRPSLASFGAGHRAESEATPPTPPTLSPAPAPEAKKPAPTPAAGSWIIAPTLPAAWEQNEAFGKNLVNFIDRDELAALRPARRTKLPKR